MYVRTPIVFEAVNVMGRVPSLVVAAVLFALLLAHAFAYEAYPNPPNFTCYPGMVWVQQEDQCCPSGRATLSFANFLKDCSH